MFTLAPRDPRLGSGEEDMGPALIFPTGQELLAREHWTGSQADLDARVSPATKSREMFGKWLQPSEPPDAKPVNGVDGGIGSGLWPASRIK